MKLTGDRMTADEARRISDLHAMEAATEAAVRREVDRFTCEGHRSIRHQANRGLRMATVAVLVRAEVAPAVTGRVADHFSGIGFKVDVAPMWVTDGQALSHVVVTW